MSLHVEHRGDILVLSGQLDHGGAASALQAARAWATGTGALRVELGGVDRCESAGVALLLEWLRLARRQGSTLQLLNPPAQLRALVRFFDLEAILFNPQA